MYSNLLGQSQSGRAAGLLPPQCTQCLLPMCGAAPVRHPHPSERWLWCWHREKLWGAGEGALQPLAPLSALCMSTCGVTGLTGQHLGTAGGFTHGVSNLANPPVKGEKWQRDGPTGTWCQLWSSVLGNISVWLTELPLAPKSASLEVVPRTDTPPQHGTAQHLLSALTQKMLGSGACSRNAEMDGSCHISFHGKMKEQSGLVLA